MRKTSSNSSKKWLKLILGSLEKASGMKTKKTVAHRCDLNPCFEDSRKNSRV